MKKRPWFIWLSIPALALLAFGDTARRIFFTKKEREDGKWIRFWRHIMGLWIGVVLLPMFIFLTLSNQIGGHFETGSFGARILQILYYVVLYFAGVYAAYRHALWREENLVSVRKYSNLDGEHRL